MNCTDINFTMNRREFFGRFAFGLGGAALFSLLNRDAFAAATAQTENPFKGILSAPHFPAKARRVIYLFMAGGPSQLDLFDYKPLLNERNGQDLPESVRMGQRLTGMTGYQATLPMAGSLFKFARYGQNGAWVSELMPWTAKMVDELCFIKSAHTEAINHDPAITFFQTGSQLAGRPSMGAWLSYGLGSANENLPAFVVLVSKDRIDQPLYARLWGNGFLPSIHQGVQFRSGKDPVLFLQNPEGISSASRRKLLDRLAQLEALQSKELGDPAINERVAQYEMAFRMQTSVPDVMDLSKESADVFKLYGDEAKNPGTFAANCLLARRLAERGVRFIQLYHPGWDHHGALPKGIRRQAKDVDQACYALVTDLKQRGLLQDALVVWGGEFGRTSYSQGKLTKDDYGRDHHPRCFTVWLSGAGLKRGFTYGQTDAYGYNVADERGEPIQPDKQTFTPGAVHVHDLQA